MRLFKPCVLALGLLLAVQPLQLQARGVPEYSLKAMLFYRLAQFVEWPASRNAQPMRLCVVGQHPMRDAIASLQLPDNVQVVTDETSWTLGDCHLLFIVASEADRIDQWLHKLEGLSVLSVSDLPGFARRGGMVELPLEGARVGIIVNRDAVQRGGLSLRAKLLRLARVLK